MILKGVYVHKNTEKGIYYVYISNKKYKIEGIRNQYNVRDRRNI